eukprot:TRINITY_DN5055_c0_g1_i1.p1 TRINITY_DN5055_c0_g1~~TRINITY_DN5055_c0_g1_i1.p1  ORF type:complete len:391 (+),score=112.89 TRINITY_DN5055_c0_g1_i1:196-1368(+)
MGAVDEKSYSSRLKRIALSSLCKYLSISPDTMPDMYLDYTDVSSLFSSLLQSPDGQKFLTGSENQEEIFKWLRFADNFHADACSTSAMLKSLNEALSQRSVLASDGLCLSIADIVVFTYLHDSVAAHSERNELPNLLRWFDYMQNKIDFSSDFEKIKIEKSMFMPMESKLGGKTSSSNNVANEKASEKDPLQKQDGKKQKKTEKENANLPKQKKKEEENVSAPKDTEASVTLLNIRVGVIQKASKHASADSLLVEEIDVGEEKMRQVVSGLAKYFSPDDLLNRKVLVVTNVKPGKLRDVMSSGLVLCASNEDHSKVEPVSPPDGAKIGEQVTFSGHEGKPEEVLNPKKKQFEKIAVHLHTDANGVATYKGVPFMTSAGPCHASLANAIIK